MDYYNMQNIMADTMRENIAKPNMIRNNIDLPYLKGVYFLEII